MTTQSPVSPNDLHHVPAHATAPPVAVARAASHALRVAAWVCLVMTPVVFIAAFTVGELVFPHSDTTYGAVADALIDSVLWAVMVATPLAAFALSILDFRAVRRWVALLPALVVLGATVWIEIAGALAVEEWGTTPWWWYAVAPVLLAVLLVGVLVHRAPR